MTYTPAFLQFWSAYPRRVAKAAAARAWAKAIEATPAEVLITAAHEYAASDKGQGKYCPHAATWLNQERWLDDRSTWNESARLTEKNTSNLAALEAFAARFAEPGVLGDDSSSSGSLPAADRRGDDSRLLDGPPGDDRQ